MAIMPSRMIAWAMTVAVVVPSPTMSLVLIAASLTSWAPMFSNWLLRWISRAIVTPSLVTTGVPVIFSRITLRPLGPNVDLTASASWSTPDSNRLRASSPNRSSLAMFSPGPVVVRSGVSRLGDEDRPAPDQAGVEVVQGLPGVGEGVGLRVQRDLACLGQHHELGQLVVGADDVADDVALGGDHVERWDDQRAAVADDEVRAGGAGHRETLVLGALLGHEIPHHVRARPGGGFPPPPHPGGAPQG